MTKLPPGCTIAFCPAWGVEASGGPKKRKTKHDYSPHFLAFYDAYPRSVGIAPAYKAWKLAGSHLVADASMKRAEAVKFLLEAAEAFAESRSGQMGRKTPHPATWPNAGRYEDDRADWDLSDEPEPEGTGSSLLIIEDEEPSDA